ncbi:MAG: hypothetical protein AB1489_33185, partial [Acidobacteriota bacterium]
CENPLKTDSHLLKVGRAAYQTDDQEALQYLKGLDIVPVQRNNGIDALLKSEIANSPIPIRVQRPGESLLAAALSLYRAAKTKKASIMLVIATEIGLDIDISASLPREVYIVDATTNAVEKLIRKLLADTNNNLYQLAK